MRRKITKAIFNSGLIFFSFFWLSNFGYAGPIPTGILDAPVKAISSANRLDGSSISGSLRDRSEMRHKTSAKNSSSKANIDDELICRNAVQDDKPEWETGYHFREDVKEAISRNLSPQKCFSLTGAETRLASRLAEICRNAVKDDKPEWETGYYLQKYVKEAIQRNLSPQKCLSLIDADARLALRRAEEEGQRAAAARRAEEEGQRAAAARRAEEERQRLEAARRAVEERKRREAEELELRKPVLTSGGSGFSISADGYVLTNHHVVEGCQVVTVHPKSSVKKATLLATDDANDLALLKIETENSEAMSFRSTNASLLEDIIVAGYPLSESLSDTVKVTKGVVSSLAGANNDYSIMQIDAAVQPGNSGGPVLDEEGNVVGITVAQLAKRKMLQDQGIIPENTNFAIKVSVARTFAEANGISSNVPSRRSASRVELANLITNATHFIGCWAVGEEARKVRVGNNLKLNAAPSVVKQVAAFK